MNLTTQLQDSGGHSQQQVWEFCFKFCDGQCIEQTLNREYSISLTLTILTLVVSIYHIYKHLTNFNNPFFQSKIIVILIMAPFYCVTSMGSFILPQYQAYFTLTRDFYQAILLFTFFYLIFSYLAYDRDSDLMIDKKVYMIMIAHEKQVHHFFPFNLCQKPYQLTHWKKAKYFSYRCKKFVLQFLIVKLVTTFLMYIIYPNTNLEQPGQSYLFVASLVNWVIAISASYSLYYLVLFYHALREPLAPYSPLLKFLTIKITLFFTFWQKIMISIFQSMLLSCFDQQSQHYHPHQIIGSLENTLICFQMLIMAIAGGMAYSYTNYEVQYSTNRGTFVAVLKDTIRTFQNDCRLIRPKKFGYKTSKNQEIQLQQISNYRRNSQAVGCKIAPNISIKEVYIQNFF